MKTMVCETIIFLGGLMACAAVCSAADSDWLNARDCGASGAKYETVATTVAGSNQITAKDVGDFKVGQGVMVSRCNVRYTNKLLWGPRSKYGASKALGDTVEIRGYDGGAGSWIVYALDVEPGSPPGFRWTDDIGRTWKPKVAVTGDWQPLGGGTEVKFGKLDWESGYTVTFSARDQLVSRIEKIDGNALTLKDAANRSAQDAIVRHCDDAALQAAIDQGIKEKRNVYVPPGYYRLSRSVNVRNASGITVEASSPEHTVLDISEGEGGCINLSGGTEVNLRNFRMVGHTGFADRDIAGYFNTSGARGIWGFYLKSCCAVTIANTERVLVENCHGSRMSCECFASGGRSRGSQEEPNQAFTKSTTYLRCSATDCGRNGFNDWNCGPENTSVLYCRIVDVGGCAWESASRFVKFVGNYVRNAGTVAIGNLGVDNRDASFEHLGSGQHIVADNVFESTVPYGGCAIRTARGATQVIIRNNLFINFGSSAVEASAMVGPNEYPSANTTITGNIFDMSYGSVGTAIGPASAARTAIHVSASDTIVSDNQIYVRGTCDPKVTAIRLTEPVTNVAVHDNLIQNCGFGLITGRAQSRVGEVPDAKAFIPSLRTTPLDLQNPQQCQGWNLVWLSGGKPAGVSVIEGFDPKTWRFSLKEPRDVKVGDAFELFPNHGANWNLHSNTITGCLNPVVFDSCGSESSLFRDNTVTPGDTAGIPKAVVIGGRLTLIGNHFSGFDETGSSVLMLQPDRFGTPIHNLLRDNRFENCSNVVGESEKGLWQACSAEGNLFVNCGSTPK